MFCETWRKGSHFFENYQILVLFFYRLYDFLCTWGQERCVNLGKNDKIQSIKNGSRGRFSYSVRYRCQYKLTDFRRKVWKYRKMFVYLQRTTKETAIMSTQTMTPLIAEYFKTQPVLKAWIFGSYSRGEQRADSDVDILILPDKSQHFSLFTLSEIYEDLKELLGREVDVITVGGLMPFARESADRDKILIYERAA